MQLICTRDATASNFQHRRGRLAGHDLARMKQFWDDYKFGKLQFLKAASPVFYSLWKVRQRCASSHNPARDGLLALWSQVRTRGERLLPGCWSGLGTDGGAEGGGEEVGPVAHVFFALSF